MKMKKVLSLLLVLVMLAALAACGNSAANQQGNNSQQGNGSEQGSSANTKDDGKVYTWRIGIGNGGTEEGNPIIYYMCRVAEMAEERSGGRLQVEQYIGGTLGSNSELPQGLVDGTVDSAILPSQFFTSTVPDLYVLDLSNVYDSAEQILDILNNKDTVIRQHAQEKGIQIGAYLKLYPRYTITMKEINSVADYSGLKLWFATSRVLSNKCISLNGVPCNFASSDLAVSLQNGTVDGAWCDMSMMKNLALYDFAKYVTKAPGDPMISMFCISNIWFNSLPEDLQAIVLEVAAECAELEYERADLVGAQLEQELADNGCIINEVGQEFIDEMSGQIGDEGAWLLSEFPEVKDAYDEIMSCIN